MGEENGPLCRFLNLTNAANDRNKTIVFTVKVYNILFTCTNYDIYSV